MHAHQLRHLSQVVIHVDCLNDREDCRGYILGYTNQMADAIQVFALIRRLAGV